MPLVRASRVKQGLTLSLSAHVVLLLAIGLLLSSRVTPPVPIQPSVALVFAPPAPPTEAPAEPAAPSQPAPEPAREQADPFAHAPPPQYVAPAPPRHVPPVTPTRTAQPQPTPTVQQAAAAAPVATSARPVAGMESDRPPAYPEIARRRGQQGRVVVRVNVSADGQPLAVSVEQGSGYASLDEAAVTAVERWRFIPATRDGSPVPAVAEVPVRFQLVD